jgi:hypothetical protein
MDTKNTIDTRYLFEWSENYNFPSPASLFLDLIGWSEEQFGERLCAGVSVGLGYLEADLLGKALQEWSSYPSEVWAWIEDWSSNQEG